MKNPGAKAPGCLGRNVGRNCPTEAPRFQPSLIGRGNVLLSPVRYGPLPARTPPDRPPLTPWRFATSRGLPPALRRGGGFQDLLAARPRSLLIARTAAVHVGYVRTDSDSPDSLYVPTSTGRSSSSSGIELQSELVTRMVLPSGSFSP